MPKPPDDFDIEAFRRGLEKSVKASRLETLKRWAQANCEHCGRPLENIFDRDGKPMFRVCVPCEREAIARESENDA